MKHSLKYIICIFFFTVQGVHTLSAQQELMLSQMSKVWQFNSINPAFFPENKRIVVGLPAFSVDAYHSGTLSYNDFFTNVNGQKFIDFNQVVDQLQPQNEISYRHRIETASVGFRLPGKGKTAVSLSHAIRFQSNVGYSKELVQLLWQGNGQFIGQTVDVAPSTRTFDWHELSVGISRNLGKIRFGAHLKYLAGISALVTDPNANKLSVYTNPDYYQLQLTTDYGFQSAGIISAIDTNGLGFKVVTNELKNSFKGANSGLAFDLGFTWTVTKKLTLYASALDLSGSLRFEAAKYFKSKGTFAFNGAVIPGADIINGASNIDFSAKVDTLNDIFKFESTTNDFSVTIPTRLYAGGNYELTKRLTVGGSLYYENGLSEKKYAFGVSAQWHPIKLIGFGLMYSSNKQKAASLGGMISLNPGPIRCFFASDNLLGAFSPYASSRVSFRTGLSFLL